MDELGIEIADGIAVLTLNRPDSLNALNRGLRDGLVAALKDLDADQNVRAIILTGTGRAFCAGLDVRELEGSGNSVTDNIGSSDIGATIGALKTPLIAAINGLAVTGGFEITLACDIVVAADTAWFQDTHAKIGLLPGWGLSQRLPRIVGPSSAKEISLTARRIPAAEAAQMGFVTRVVAPDDLPSAAREIAAGIAQWDPAHIARIKAVIDDGYGLPLRDALALESERAADLNRQVTLAAGETKHGN